MAGFAASAAATIGGAAGGIFGSGASVAAAFFVCLAITSRRCFSRRRSSRHSCSNSVPRPATSFTDAPIAPKKRPKENCVDMMMPRKISVRMTMIDPVRFKYSDIAEARNSPR